MALHSGLRMARPHGSRPVAVWTSGGGSRGISVKDSAFLLNFVQHQRTLSSYPSNPRVIPPAPTLFDYILQKRFDSVLDRAKSHPGEARYPHPRRWTALHACVEYDAPLEVISEIIRAYPEALEIKDWRGKTPLEIAVKSKHRKFLKSFDPNALEDEGNIPSKGEEVHFSDEPFTANGTSSAKHESVEELVNQLGGRITQLAAQCKSLEADVVRLRNAIKKG